MELHEQMRALPDPAGSNETALNWNVREVTLSIGRNAAIDLQEWQQALDLNS
jgi:hypothetical protein